jgi:hypothetical protein
MCLVAQRERDTETESKREKSHAYPVSQLYMEVHQAGLSSWLLPEIHPTELVCGNHEERGE